MGEAKTAQPRRIPRAALAAAALASAACCLLVAATLLAVAALEDRNAFAAQMELAALQAALERSPSDAGLRESLRDVDERIRSGWFYRRSLVTTGALVLLAAAAASVISLRLFMRVSDSELRPHVAKSGAGEGEASRSIARGRMAISAGAVAVVCIGALAVATLGLRTAPPTALRPGGPVDPDLGWKLPGGSIAENWPQFRGPAGNGIAATGEYPVRWNASTGENVLWKAPLPLEGKGSPVVWGDRVYLTAASASEQLVICLDAATGRELWKKAVSVPAAWKTAEPFGEPGQTGYAASTPATDGRRVFALFATADLVCLDRDGSQLWAKNLGAPNNTYGLATSPVLSGKGLIVQFDQGGEEDPSEITAFDRETGRVLWKTPRKAPCSWSTPIVVEHSGLKLLVAAAKPNVFAYDAATGRELWWVSGLGEEVAPSPAAADGLVFAANEYSKAFAIRLGGSGDVTASHVAWELTDGLPDVVSPLAASGLVLLTSSSGRVAAHAVSDGHVVWEHGFGEGFNASPVLAGGRVYMVDLKGVCHVFGLGTEFKEEAASPVGEAVQATPTLAGGRIFIRGEKHLFCIGTGKKGEPAGGKPPP